MSAAHRSLARLPLEIFENLVSSSNSHATALMKMAKDEQVDEKEEDDEFHEYYIGGNANADADPLACNVLDAAILRNAICQKLKSIPPSKQMPHRRKSLRAAAAAAAKAAASAATAASSSGTTVNGNSTSTTISNNATLLDSIQTVGPLLFMSKPALLRVLDPLLTYEECSELIRRICLYCSPTPKSAMALLHMTRDEDLDQDAAAALNCRQQPQLLHDDYVDNTSTKTTTTTTATIMTMNQPVVRHIPTGLPSLDHQLRGGVRVGTLTEIVGLTATAKSQLAMQLCIMAGIGRLGLGAAGGQCHGAVYIDSEKKMSLQRLEEMAMHASRQYVQQQQQQLFHSSQSLTQPRPLISHGNLHYVEEESFRCCRDFLANVSVHTPTTMDELSATLAFVEEDIYLRNERAQEEALRQPQQQQQQQGRVHVVGNGTAMRTTSTFPVRLLILDSIAAPARREFGSGSAPQRAAVVMQCAQTLKRLADELQLAVVVLNQVDQSTSSTSSALQHQQHRAALGTAWHHCVSTRIHLSSLPPRQPIEQGDNGDGDYSSSMIAPSAYSTQQEQMTRIPRLASIVKSNVTGQGQPVPFEVTTRGLVEMLPTNDNSRHNYMT